MGLSKEIKKETIGNASLKDFVSIIAADTDRYKRKDTITNVNTNRDIQDVRLKEEQYLWKINSLIQYQKKRGCPN